MLETIKNQNLNNLSISRSAFEVKHFMDNFFDAVSRGDHDEVETYYADEAQVFHFPYDITRDQEVLLVDDHLATFSCALETRGITKTRWTCVLDKSEGYWQIIHGQVAAIGFDS